MKTLQLTDYEMRAVLCAVDWMLAAYSGADNTELTELYEVIKEKIMRCEYGLRYRMITGDNKEFLRKYGKIVKQPLLDENPPPCPISGGECCYTDPPHPIPCEICQANIEQAKKREEATTNETLLFMRSKRKW